MKFRLFTGLISLWSSEFLASLLEHLSSLHSVAVAAGLVRGQEVWAGGLVRCGQIFINPSTVSPSPQTLLFNICLHLWVHRTGHLLFLSPPLLPLRLVNLIKAAIKQRFICLGPNLPYRRHVTTYAAHTCRMSSRSACCLSTMLALSHNLFLAHQPAACQRRQPYVCTPPPTPPPHTHTYSVGTSSIRRVQ